MSGKNQHHIPRFLQRGFAVDGTDQHKIWRFEPGRLPKKPRSIRSTGSEDNFYSDEADDASSSLDCQITEEETPLANRVNDLRAMAIGTPVPGAIAAELINHFAPRAAYLRQTIERGMRQLVAGANDLFTNQANLKALLGIDRQGPDEIFREKVGDALRGNPAIIASGIPDRVIERMAFHIAKEQFEAVSGEMMPMLRQLFDNWTSGAAETVKTGHNKALGKRGGSNARYDLLASLMWRIEGAPPEGNVLPDCVALAVQQDGSTASWVFADLDEIRAVIMPLSSQALLVGRRDNAESPAAFRFNQEAARASHRFFLAATNAPEILALQPLIDERTANLIDAPVAHAIKDFMPPKPSPAGDLEAATDGETSADEGCDGAAEPWSYELSLIGCGDQDTASKISEAVNQLVGALARSLPLRGLNGITFADDYPAALTALDRGIPGVGPATTIDPAIGVGIAQTVSIVRDGIVMSRIVMSNGVAHALISDDPGEVDWAIAVIVRQLALVTQYAILDATLPGVLLTRIQQPLQGVLYGAVGAAIDGYTASHICAGFGDPDAMAATHRELLTDALHRMRDTVLPARLAYRYHGDLDALLAVAMPAIRHVLLFAADLLGHCAALGTEAVAPASTLATALDIAGLRAWLGRYATDLEAFRHRLGRWQSFDEFLAFTVHVERLLWQLGMVPWESDNGLRFSLPLGTDADALMAGIAPTTS